MTGFNLTQAKQKDFVKMNRFYCKLSKSYRYRLYTGINSDDTENEFYGELRQGLNGNWNWYLRGNIAIIAKGEGSYDECLAQIKDAS